MKNLILVLLLFQFIEINSQVANTGTVIMTGIVAKNPPTGFSGHPICMEDNMVISFKFKPSGGSSPGPEWWFHYTTANLTVYTIRSFSYTEFYSLSKKFVSPDTIYSFEHLIPAGFNYMDATGHIAVEINSGSPNPGRNIQIIDCTGLGIEELNQNGQIPVYYDLRGNVIDWRSNELIIEQVGVNRRKIFIQK